MAEELSDFEGYPSRIVPRQGFLPVIRTFRKPRFQNFFPEFFRQHSRPYSPPLFLSLYKGGYDIRGWAGDPHGVGVPGKQALWALKSKRRSGSPLEILPAKEINHFWTVLGLKTGKNFRR